jgi:hypothetical protein
MGWITWLAMIAVGTVIAFIIAEVIPFFNDLLSISSSLFISGFTFYFPALMWFMLIREGSIFSSRKNMALAALNALCFCIGIVTLVAGTYSSIKDIVSFPLCSFFESLLIQPRLTSTTLTQSGESSAVPNRIR